MRILSVMLYVCLAAAAQSSSYNALVVSAHSELKQAHYSQAIPILTKALSDAESRNDNIDAAAALSDLGEANRGLGRCLEAEAMFKRSINLLRHEASPRHLATVLLNLGTLYRESGDYPRAIESHQETLEIAKKIVPADDPFIAAVLNGLGADNYWNLNFGDARRYLQQALRIREAKLGPDHLDVSETLNNLGAIYVSTKQYEKAERAIERALPIEEKILGADHPDVATTLNNLGVLHYTRRRYPEAERVLRRALDIRTRRLPADHPAIATSSLNLARLLLVQNQSSEAEGLLRNAVLIRNSHRHLVDREEVMIYEQYAIALRTNGNVADANVMEARANSMRAELRYTLRS